MILLEPIVIWLVQFVYRRLAFGRFRRALLKLSNWLPEYAKEVALDELYPNDLQITFRAKENK